MARLGPVDQLEKGLTESLVSAFRHRENFGYSGNRAQPSSGSVRWSPMSGKSLARAGYLKLKARETKSKWSAASAARSNSRWIRAVDQKLAAFIAANGGRVVSPPGTALKLRRLPLFL